MTDLARLESMNLFMHMSATSGYTKSAGMANKCGITVAIVRTTYQRLVVLA
jgi:hypothetical protein